jgi:hypothetical protein
MSDFKNIAEPLMERINKLETEKKQYLDTIMSQQETIKQQQETINNLSKTPQKVDEKNINLVQLSKNYDEIAVLKYEYENSLLIRISFNNINPEEFKIVSNGLDIHTQANTNMITDERLNKFRNVENDYCFYMDITKFDTIGRQFLLSINPEFSIKINDAIGNYNHTMEKMIGDLPSKITALDNFICITYSDELFDAPLNYLTKLFNCSITNKKELKLSLDDFVKVFVPKIGFKPV